MNKEFYETFKRLLYYLNEVDSLDFVGLSPTWYSENLSDDLRQLLISCIRFKSNFVNDLEDE